MQNLLRQFKKKPGEYSEAIQGYKSYPVDQLDAYLPNHFSKIWCFVIETHPPAHHWLDRFAIQGKRIKYKKGEQVLLPAWQPAKHTSATSKPSNRWTIWASEAVAGTATTVRVKAACCCLSTSRWHRQGRQTMASGRPHQCSTGVHTHALGSIGVGGDNLSYLYPVQWAI